MTNDLCEAVLKIVWKARNAAVMESAQGSLNIPESEKARQIMIEEADRLNKEWMEALADLAGVEWEDLAESVRFDRVSQGMITSED